MFTKFAPIAILLGAPLLSTAAPAPLFGINLGATNPTTVTVFQCPPSASPSLASSSVAASASASAPAALGTGGGSISLSGASDPATDLLNGLTSIGSLLNGLTNTLLPNILSSVTSLLNTLTGSTGQLNDVQGQIGTLTSQLGGVTSGLNGLAGTLSNLGTGGASSTNGNDIFNTLQGILNNLSGVTGQITSITNGAQGSGANLSGLKVALNSLLNACLASRNPKRGFPLVTGSEADLVKTNNGQCSWFYNWSPSPSPAVPAGLAFVPMQWGRENVAQFVDTVRKSGAKIVLGFNEPELGGQSNIPPAEAAQLWQQYIQPLKSAGVRLGSPAVSSAPAGLPWLASFMKECTRCTIDFVVVHWFGEGANNFIGYLERVHATFPQYSVWITEFACASGNSGDIATFLAAALKFLDGPAQGWIERYSWFAFARSLDGLQSNLLDGNGNLNVLGVSYIAESKALRSHARRRRRTIGT
ncbi:glycosyl hydrolase catalytic core-domain-containing protein [Mycena alexandri]|uniref:Glycosyl hydrolase catalytic core-domain-containing protein n=1 Tax=Mycena alexandri TaxID=1745969 RepID=A0AAD6SSD1_9AGAR|nr:glycosyl hydrolase catalytic core-domain-containing protein [Mycena alexandri]